MLVEQYFAELEATIARFGSVRANAILKDIRSPYIGYFRAEIRLARGDGSDQRLPALPAVIADRTWGEVKLKLGE